MVETNQRLLRPRPAVLLASVVLALVASLLVAPPAARAEPAQGVRTVVARDDSVTVAGSAPAGSTVAIHALGTEAAETSWSDGEPVATVTADADGGFTATVPRAEGRTDLYYAKYLAVVDGAVLGTFRYVDDNQVTPLASYPYPEPLNKKGVTLPVTDDAEEIGVQHATVNLPLNQLMLLEPVDPANMITFTSNGRTFYFDADLVEARDRQIKPSSDNGMVVNLIFLVQPTTDPNSAGRVLAHPDADPQAGRVLGFNTLTAEGVAYYTAAVEFFAQRYTRSDRRYGRATGFIVGNEINAQWAWANMGDKPVGEFVRDYERALRITDLAARAAYSEARTYISLTHCWITVCGTNPDPERPTRFYPAPDVIEGINQLSKDHGDYGWHVAHHPYPQTLANPAFWKDDRATGDIETTPMMTFKNIELLPQYLGRSELRYDGQPRRIILSEQGCNMPGTTAEAERLQAACYALAYYKVRFLDGIDSFILHRHVDHKREGSFRFGLWTADEERPEPDKPDRPKLIHDVFALIDTERSLEATKFALDVIGIDDWSELVPGWDPAALAQRPLPEVAGISTTARLGGTTPISTFDQGTDGWQVSDNAASVAADNGDLVIGFNSLAKLWRGSDVEFAEPLDASSTPYVGVRLRVPYQQETGPRYARIKAYGETGGAIAAGTARLADDGDEQQLTLDLSRWAARSSISRLKIWVRGSTNIDWSGTVRVAEVVRADRLADTGRTTNVNLTAVAPEGGRVGAPARLTLTNWDIRPVDGSLRVVPGTGIAIDPASFEIDRLPTGEQRTFTGTITGYEPPDIAAPELELSVQDVEYRVPLELPPPTPVELYDFDDGTAQGWQPGINVSSAAAVTTFLNGPRLPHDGSHALEAVGAGVAASAPRTVVLRPAQPLDLSAAHEVAVFLNSYGGAPDATGYEATFTLYSGTDRVTITAPYSPNRWNELVVPVTDWAGRSAIDRIEVGMRALGTETTWSGRFQVDSVGYYDRPRR
ncbi:DUF5722 domain-containing protein [Microlunatus sp. GCM10028923]|uniref:DUF5722 domain-containing protein n=1 Tax=Microlunatus sp. GCM10028923 TaxID=3273400 RepID=UPI003617C881